MFATNMDRALFMDGLRFQPNVYSDAKADGTVERYQNLGCVYLAVMLEDEPVGAGMETVFADSIL